MNYADLKADNEDLPSSEGRILSSNENFQIWFKPIFIDRIVQIFNLNSNSKRDFELLFDKKIENSSDFGKIENELFLILNVSNRYLMVQNLLSQENELNFGIFGLLFYLGLTCFDSLGQGEDYKTFYEWLISKRNHKIKEIQARMDLNKSIDLRNEIIRLFDEQYNPIFGVRNSFFCFINSIKERDSHKELFSCIDIRNNVYKLKLKQHNELELLKSMWMFSFRNDFTHNSRNTRWTFDNNWFCTSYKLKDTLIPIEIVPNKLVISILNCIKDGIEIKLNELNLNK